jgi:hypothetical protein
MCETDGGPDNVGYEHYKPNFRPIVTCELKVKATILLNDGSAARFCPLKTLLNDR